MKTTKFKRLIATLLAAAMIVGMFTMYAYAANGNTDQTAEHKTTFTDVTPDKWYYEAVMTMADAGAVNGYGNGKFGPNDPITYGQFFLIVMRLCWPETHKDGDRTYESLDAYTCAMIDCSTYLNAGPFGGSGQCYAVKDGQVMPASYWWDEVFERDFGKLPNEWKDVKANTYANVPVQRGQAMTYLAKLATRVKVNNAKLTVKTTDIPDWDVVVANDIDTVYGSWDNGTIAFKIGIPTLWKDYVLQAYQRGIVQGTDKDMTCNPMGTVTRAQFCQMLYNMGLCEPRPGTIRLH